MPAGAGLRAKPGQGRTRKPETARHSSRATAAAGAGILPARVDL